jgi:hypothetical protein
MKRKTRVKRAGIDPEVLMGYHRWVARHLDEMSRKYPHKIIGVYRGKLIAVGDSFKEVYAPPALRGSKRIPSRWKFLLPKTWK